MNITFSIEEFTLDNGYSQENLAIIHKYFGDRTIVEISVIPILLNGSFGGFDLSDEAKRSIITKMPVELLPRFFMYGYDATLKFRTNPVVIDTIQKIGLKKASGMNCSLYFAGIPANYTDCVSIDDYDGIESVIFNLNNAIKNLVLDDTISSDEKMSRLKEYAFISIVFKKFVVYFQ